MWKFRKFTTLWKIKLERHKKVLSNHQSHPYYYESSRIRHCVQEISKEVLKKWCKNTAQKDSPNSTYGENWSCKRTVWITINRTDYNTKPHLAKQNIYLLKMKRSHKTVTGTYRLLKSKSHRHLLNVYSPSFLKKASWTRSLLVVVPVAFMSVLINSFETAFSSVRDTCFYFQT